MPTKFPHVSILARVFFTSLMLVALGLGAQRFSSDQESVTVGPAGYDTVGAPTPLPAKQEIPEVLARGPVPAQTAVSLSPTPVAPKVPEWGQVRVDTPLRAGAAPGSVAAEFVPNGSYLKLLRAENNSFLVLFGGDGREHKGGQGWVSSSDVSPSLAPKWVEARRGIDLWAEAAPSARKTGTVPTGTVLEVLGEQGARAHIYDLGDGVSRDAAEGWVDMADLAPAGPALTAEERGVRLLTESDVQSIQSTTGMWLRVPYRSQLDGGPSQDANCGPASVGMALQFFHKVVPTAEVRAAADKLQGTSDPEGGFAIEFLQGAVEQFGLKGLNLAVGKDLRRWSLDDAKRELSQGHPVIPQLRYRNMPGRGDSDYGEDHYVVLTGMRGDDFIYNDPVDVDGPGYGRLMSAEDLKKGWGTSYFPFAAFAVAAP
jgi:hypothetical protein